MKTKIIMTFGLPGVGKTNVLFKLAHFYNQKNIAPNVTLISANDFNLGQDAICEQFSNIAKIPFISCKNLEDFNYESDKTYFIDFSANQSDQERIIEFFDTGDFYFFPIFVIPAWMSFPSLKKHICLKYQQLNSFSVILSFCDHATKREKKFYENYLEKNYNNVIGYNSSGYLHEGLEVTPVLDGLKVKGGKNKIYYLGSQFMRVCYNIFYFRRLLMTKTKSNLNKEHESFATYKRIVRYDEMIASGTFPNVEDFKREFKVSEATVHRDLDALRMDFGAEFVLEYDRCHKGYYYTRPTFRVPGHLTTSNQIIAASLMQNLIESLHGTPLYNQAIEVFANFSDNIEPDSQISLGKELSKKICFIGMEPVQISNKVWDNIETALAKNQYITFDYSFYDGNEQTQKYTIAPWQLLYYQGMWSLYGNVPKEKKEKFFNLPLISNVEVRKETFEPPKDCEYLKKAKGNFGRYIGSEIFNFKIRINRDITANYIKTYKWTDDQKFETQADGTVIMTFSSNQYYPVLNWIMSQGQWITPLEPQQLVEEWKENVLGMMKNVNK